MNAVEFLKQEMQDSGIPFTIMETFLGDVILRINSKYDGDSGDCEVCISPTLLDNAAATRWQGSQGFATFEESTRVANHITLAAEIAQKWKAHVEAEKTLADFKESVTVPLFENKHNKIGIIKEYRKVTGYGLLEAKHALYPIHTCQELSEVQS